MLELVWGYSFPVSLRFLIRITFQKTRLARGGAGFGEMVQYWILVDVRITLPRM